MITYRALTQQDIDDVYEIELECFAVPWSYEGLSRDIIENPCALYIGAFDDSRLLGYAGMWVVLDEAHITNIAVRPEWRGQGIGKCLLKGLIHLARSVYVYSLTLEVRPSNMAALRLYESEGFVTEGLRKKYYSDNGEDALIMWLRCENGHK